MRWRCRAEPESLPGGGAWSTGGSLAEWWSIESSWPTESQSTWNRRRVTRTRTTRFRSRRSRGLLRWCRGRRDAGCGMGDAGGGFTMKSSQRSNSWLIALPVIALLLWSVIYPNAAVIAGSFEDGLGHWREFFASPADREALRTSIIISVASVFASLAIGLPLAFLLGRFEFPGRRLLRAVATLPAALPPLVGVIAFLFLYGESGVVTRTIQRAFGMAEAPWRLQGIGAIVFVQDRKSVV